MNTKFDVGQRVTYPVVQTLEGKITGISVGKSGAINYAIGAHWYAESDLTPNIFGGIDNSVVENPATEPVKEGEPVKLYCVKDYRGKLTRGKIYEVKDGFMRYDDGSKAFMQWMDIAEDIKESWLFKDGYLVPLVRRPAKVGEWVYVTGGAGKHAYTTNRIYKAFRVCDDFGDHPNSVFFDNDGRGCVNPSEYFVLDGYRGDSE